MMGVGSDERRQAIVDCLLRDVFQGRLRAGQHLVTQAMADRFGVSHTPIREALIALAGIGIVDVVRQIRNLVREVYDLRLETRPGVRVEFARGLASLEI